MTRFRRSARVRVGAWVALVAVAAGVLGPRRADAFPIGSSPLEEVVAASSHVALGAFDVDTKRFVVERWLRGDWPEPSIELQSVPAVLRSWMLGHEEVRRPFLRKKPEGQEHLGRRAILFLEVLDGRLHVTGYRRYGPTVASHSSIRHVTAEGRILQYRQTMNPGGLDHVDAEADTLETFLLLLDGVMRTHPYTAPKIERSAIPPVHRATFFAALGDTIDWYEGDWPTTYPGAFGRISPPAEANAAAQRLYDWAMSVPHGARLPALEALAMLCTEIQGGGPDRTPITLLAYRLLPQVDAEAALRWILRDVRFGGYYTDRTGLAMLAGDLGPAAEEQVLAALDEVTSAETGSLGTSAYWALRSLGHEERAEAALARAREKEANPKPTR